MLPASLEVSFKRSSGRNEVLIYAPAQRKLENIRLSDVSQTWTDTVISFIWGIKNRQFHRGRKSNGVAKGWDEEAKLLINVYEVTATY